MCVSPVLIRNPNYQNRTELIQKISDTESEYIKVPCNHCPECVSARQNQLVDRCRCLSLDHYIFFCTLTYNRQSLPHLSTSTGFDIPYADISDVQKMFKRIRKSDLFGRPFLYFGVSERGKKGSRPHFHLLLFLKKYDDDDKLTPAKLESTLRPLVLKEWRRNYGSNRVPVWKPLCTYRSKYVGGKRYSNYDLHYVVPHSSEHGSDDVAFYVSKYILKSSENEKRLQQALHLNLVKVFDDGSVDDLEYNNVWSVVRSRSFFSKGFGAATDMEVNFVKGCIERSKSDPDGLKFFHQDGSSSQLPRYYRKFLSEEAALESVSATGGPISFDDRTLSEKMRSIERGKKIVQQVSEHDISLFYPND